MKMNMKICFPLKAGKFQGKILKVRLGFNPNSSSIGFDISVFLWSAVLITTVVNAIMAFVSILRSREDKDEG